MAEVKHELFLSTIDKEFYSTPIKVRNSDVDTQVLKVEVSEYGKPKSFKGLTPFFCLMARKITGQGVSEEPVKIYNAALGTLEYIMSANAFQMVGQNEAYFSFRKEMKNGEWIEQFSTRSFKYIVEESIYTVPFKDSNHFWTFDELHRKFNNYIESGKNSWEEFVEQNREIIESVDPSGKLLNEIIDSRGDFDSLENRLEHVDKKLATFDYTKNELIEDVTDNPIYQFTRPYFREKLVEFKQAIKSDHLNIIFATDHHSDEIFYPGGKDSYDHLANVGFLSDKVDVAILGGDNTNNDSHDRNNQTVERMKLVTNDFARRFFTVSEADNFILKGNHDDGSGKMIYEGVLPEDKKMDQIITNEEFKDLYRTRTNLYNEHRLNSNLYFFKDYEKNGEKIRIIGLNMFDTPEIADGNGDYKYPNITFGGLQNEQLNWLANVALKCESDRHVLIFGHCPINGTTDTRSTFYNHEILLQILNAFVNGEAGSVGSSQTDFKVAFSYDFSIQGVGTLAAYVCGHTHRDKSIKLNGINFIETTTSCDGALGDSTDSERLNRTGTYEEDAFDVIEVNTKTNTLYFNRFGWGKNRVFTY